MTYRAKGSERLFLFVPVALAGVLLACGNTVTAQDSSEQSSDEVVLKVQGKDFTLADVEAKASDTLDQVAAARQACEMEADKNRHTVLANTAEQMVRELLIEEQAEKAGEDPKVWLAAEKARQMAAVSDEHVDSWYTANQARLRGRAKEEIAEQIRDLLATENLHSSLREAASVDVNLDPYRLEVAAVDAPSKGAADPKITLIEFSDFECPFCGRVNPSLAQVMETYGDSVQVVFRQFPLESIHPNARKAAEAALCAEEQGKFWEMHDLLFAEQKELGVDQLKDKAVRLELDTEAFNACLDSGRKTEIVDRDLQAGSAVGVTGTPAMFINGRPLVGAVSFEDLAKVIDDELERVAP